MNSQILIIFIVIATVFVAARHHHHQHSTPQQKISCYVAEDKAQYGFTHCATTYYFNSKNTTYSGFYGSHQQYGFFRNELYIERRRVCTAMHDEYAQPIITCVCITDNCNAPRGIYDALTRSHVDKMRKFDYSKIDYTRFINQ